MSDSSETAALLDWCDWATIGMTAVAASAALLLGAPLWAAVIVALAGTTVMVARGACRDLGVFEHRDAGEPEASPSAVASPPLASESPSAVARPSAGVQPALSLPPHATGKP